MKALNSKTGVTKLIYIILILIFDIVFAFTQNTIPRRTFNFKELRRNGIKSINILASQTITATQTQAINFGTYCVYGTGGGTVSIGWDGSRTSTGNIVLLNISPMAQPAIFEIKPADGNTVSFNYAPTGVLKGSNGGSLTFDIGPTEKGVNGASFSVNNNTNVFIPFKVGGTLHIPPNAIQGTYLGNFNITFQQE